MNARRWFSAVSLRKARAACATSALVTVAACMLVAGCSDDTAPTPGSTGAAVVHMRVINAIFQGPTNATSTAQPIDLLIDSSTTYPGITGLPANGIAPGDSANGYRALSNAGIHTFITRLAGTTTPGNPLYTTAGDLPYVPHQALASGSYYSLIVAGVVPDSGPVPGNSIPFSAVQEDPFPGPKINGAYQARFTVINAAAFTSATVTAPFSTVGVYLTPGGTPPADPITNYATLGTASYRDHSPYFNVDAGTYVITIVASGKILAQQPITFAAGEVRTFVLQSTGPSATPGVANHILTSILDHKYTS